MCIQLLTPTPFTGCLNPPPLFLCLWVHVICIPGHSCQIDAQCTQIRISSQRQLLSPFPLNGSRRIAQCDAFCIFDHTNQKGVRIVTHQSYVKTPMLPTDIVNLGKATRCQIKHPITIHFFVQINGVGKIVTLPVVLDSGRIHPRKTNPLSSTCSVARLYTPHIQCAVPFWLHTPNWLLFLSQNGYGIINIYSFFC